MGSVARYRCEKCGMEFDSITQSDDHDRTAHPGIDQV
jgi:predicted nucleic acid-binding Zn ribbon protein